MHTEFRHTYRVFRKLRQDNFLFEEWRDSFDYSTLNNSVRKLFTEHSGEAKRLRFTDDYNLVELTHRGTKLVFAETVPTVENLLGPMLILLNYFPVGTSYPKSGLVAVEFKDKFHHKGPEEQVHVLPNELADIDGELYEIEGTGSVFTEGVTRYVINTHEAFCQYCEQFHNGEEPKYEFSKEMWNDFLTYKDMDWSSNNSSKGIYDFIEFGDVYIITRFELR